MMTRNGTVGDLWHWPDGLYMLIPVCVIWVLWIILFLEHLFNLASIHDVALRFQALFCRIILIFPITGTLAYLAAAFPWAESWVNFITAIFESYCLCAFFAMLVGLGQIFYSKEILRKELIKSRWTKKYFAWCGPEFKDADQAYRIFTISVLQVAFFKPLVALIPAIILTVTGVVPNPLSVVLRVINVLSMAFALVVILRMYKFLSEAPGLPLTGHNVLWKFVVVKLLFLLLVANSVFIQPLIESGKIPVDPWLCSPDAYVETHGEEFCQIRLICVIIVFEVVVITFPACFSYRHHGLHKLDKDRKGNIPHFLYQVFINVFDLGEFIQGKIVNKELKETATPEEREGLLEEIVME